MVKTGLGVLVDIPHSYDRDSGAIAMVKTGLGVGCLECSGNL
jgi:hypothetical protein